MAFYLKNPTKTQFVETKFKYESSQAMLLCNVDNYLRFLTDKLKFVTANDDPGQRLQMVQDDKWLRDGFSRFHNECSSFPITSDTPLYISQPHRFLRACCDICSHHYCCSRNFKGKRIVCSKCAVGDQGNKRQKVQHGPSQRDPSPASPRALSSTGSNGSNGSAIRAARVRVDADASNLVPQQSLPCTPDESDSE